MPLIDLKCFLMILRSLGVGMLLVTMDIPLGYSLMNSEWVFDLALLNMLLMRPTCILALFIMRSAYFSVIGMIACFLKGPLVMIWILLLLLVSLSITILWISIIFLLGSVEKVFLILRMFLVVAVTYMNNLTNVLLLLPLVFLVDQNLDFLNCSSVGQEERDEETFIVMLLWGSFEVKGVFWGMFLVNFNLTIDLKEVSFII